MNKKEDTRRKTEWFLYVSAEGPAFVRITEVTVVLQHISAAYVSITMVTWAQTYKSKCNNQTWNIYGAPYHILLISNQFTSHVTCTRITGGTGNKIDSSHWCKTLSFPALSFKPPAIVLNLKMKKDSRTSLSWCVRKPDSRIVALMLSNEWPIALACFDIGRWGSEQIWALWLLNRYRKGVSVSPTYCILQIEHSRR